MDTVILHSELTGWCWVKSFAVRFWSFESSNISNNSIGGEVVSFLLG